LSRLHDISSHNKSHWPSPLGHFSAGVNPAVLECAKDRIEAARPRPFRGQPGPRSSPSGREGSLGTVEGWWKGGSDHVEPSFAAPEFHAALEVRVEDPHLCLA